MRCKILFFMVCAMALFSCKRENLCDCLTSTGPTNVIYRNVQNFNSIVLEDKMDLFLTQGPNYEVRVEAGANMQRLIKTELDGETLKVMNDNTCNWVRGYNHSIKVYVTAPYFKYIKHAGLGTMQSLNTIVQDEITARNENSGDLRLNVNVQKVTGSSHGNGDTYLTGQTQQLAYDYVGTNYLFTSELEVKNYMYLHSVTIGHSHIKAPENGLMDIIIEKAGNVYYSGNPKTINLTRRGKGQLIKE